MSTPDGWAAVSVLAEPTRRRVFDTVRAAEGPMTREAVARAVGIGQRLAAFHLDRLADSGMLVVDYARPAGRSGPGAGRPAKLYAPAPVQLDLSVPPRSYDLVARILACAVAAAPHVADEKAHDVAREEGRRIGRLQRPSRPARGRAARSTARSALAGIGYEPDDGEKEVRLRNCPFHDVVDVAPELVCGLNHALVTGVLEGLEVAGQCTAILAPNPPHCCVTVR